jgi:hypothetical protein
MGASSEFQIKKEKVEIFKKGQESPLQIAYKRRGTK